MKKSFIHCDFGFVRISAMSRMCRWWLRRAGTSALGVPKCPRRKMHRPGNKIGNVSNLDRGADPLRHQPGLHIRSPNPLWRNIPSCWKVVHNTFSAVIHFYRFHFKRILNWHALNQMTFRLLLSIQSSFHVMFNLFLPHVFILQFISLLSLLSLEPDPELTPIESSAFSDCWSLKSMAILCHVQIISSSSFHIASYRRLNMFLWQSQGRTIRSLNWWRGI
jgi:hypothetical protein